MAGPSSSTRIIASLPSMARFSFRSALRGSARGLSTRPELTELDVQHLATGLIGELEMPEWVGSIAHTGPGMTPRLSPGSSAPQPTPWAITDEDPISLDHYEMKVLLRALDATGGDKLEAAKLLNLGKSTLYRKLKRFGIR